MEFKIYPKVSSFGTFKEFAVSMKINSDDLIFTHRFLHKKFMKDWPAQTLFYEEHAEGEPSDIAVDAMLADIRTKAYRRLIAIGGGSVLDCSKLLAIKGAKTTEEIFEEKIPLVRDVELVMLPTTCGTGCEVTGVSVIDFPNKGTKIGKRFECSFADEAVLIGELVEGLPYDIFINSSVDALIHALEIYLAPKANAYTDIFCAEAIRRILTGYHKMEAKGSDIRFEEMESFLMASNMAGIALSNILAAAVHAMAMHFGSVHHVPHGESTRLFLMEVFSLYAIKNPEGKIKNIAEIISECLGVSSNPNEAFQALRAMLDRLLPVKSLQEYGMKEENFETYAEKVIQTQQRLLVNSYVELSKADIAGIYRRLF